MAVAPEQDTESLTRSGSTAGSPAYLAPELVSGEQARPAPSGDVYALGVTLYECLALEAPFRAPTREGLYRAILAAAPPDLRRKRRDIPRDLALVVATAIERDRGRRYRTAADFACDLEAVVAGRPIAARPLGLAERALRWARREPKQALLASVLIAAAAALSLAGGFLLASRKDVDAGRAAQRQAAVDSAIVDGFLTLNSGQFARADAIFAGLLSYQPPPPEALVGRVLSLRSLGHTDEALALLADAPHSPAYAGLRALVAGAAPPPEDSAWLKPASSLELFIDGLRLREEAERRPFTERVEWQKRALARMSEAVVRAPQARALYHSLRAQLAVEAKDAQAARSSASALLGLWPDSPREVLAAGMATMIFDKERARILLEHAAALDPTSATAFHNLGAVLHELGEDEAARVAWERAIEIGPTNAATHCALAEVLRLEGCHEEARALYLEALAFDPRSISAWTYLGLTNWNLQLYEEAAEALGHSVDLDPRVPIVRSQYGLALLLTGHVEVAREQCEIAATQAPDNAAIWCGLLEALLAGNEGRYAREVLDAALERNPSDPLLPQFEARVAEAEAMAELESGG